MYVPDVVAVSRIREGLALRWMLPCTCLALMVMLLSGGGAVQRDFTPIPFALAAAEELAEASRFPRPPVFDPKQPAVPGPINPGRSDDASGDGYSESQLVPLRGAPAWVWDLADDDPRKLAAIDDWAIVAAADREASMVVMEWAGKIMADSEFWNELCPRWLADPEWGGVGPAQ
jgi:hypothetical protein